MKPHSIRHQVIFNLKWSDDDPRTTKFLEDGQRTLTAIPGVENFIVCRQVNPQNDYAFGFAMDFCDHEAYQTYNKHPAHTAFVKDRWQTEVTRFLEIDFEGLSS